MPWLGPITAVGIVVLIVLVWLFLRARRQDLLAEIVAKRKPTSKLISRASYTGGMEAIPVVLSLGADAIYYENPDTNAFFELDRIDEIEYDDELATGHSVSEGCRVLRLRCHGAAFEFILSEADAKQWIATLPARRAGEAAAAV
ncbi:MAG TPA: hypothetical protein VGR02_19535 [Thermoanaerobaculia bacterium]|jgi:hypothetical protein|nr:hypothetical protein [Thermoanaerobaculia bacterium]